MRATNGPYGQVCRRRRGGIVNVIEPCNRLRVRALVTRTTLFATLVLCLTVDLQLLQRPEAYTLVTAAQTLLLLLAVWLSTHRPESSTERTVQRRSDWTLIYHWGLRALALTAIVEKWWIALRETAEERLVFAPSYRVTSAALTITCLLMLLSGGRRLARYFAAFAEHPARQTALSFLGLTVFGAFLLSLPWSVRDGAHISFLDSLFMATSAVCVTGLSVFDVASEYTFWGQCVLLVLVQAGGLGMMVLSASVVVLTGRKLRPRSSAVLAEVLDTESVSSLRDTIRRIVAFTLVLETLGALLLYTALSRDPNVALDHSHSAPTAGSGSLVWAAIFHAVSSFCNAGFTLTRGNLVPFANDYAVCTVVMLLIITGGLGFPVLSEVADALVRRVRKHRPQRLTLHARTVLAMSASLVVFASMLLAFVEWNAALAGLRWEERLFGALFQAVTLRTAGFNTVDFATFSSAGLMLCMLFMIVGASPGGTGGGVKVTTLAVLFATLRAELRGHDEPSLFDRRLPPGTVRRAIAVACVSVAALTVVLFLLLLCERAAPLRLAFEAVSAFGTVGLSTNLTPELGSAGKIIIIVTMLVGRVGPLTLALAVSRHRARTYYLRPHERVLIG